jgi:hypothetical protein
MTLAVGHMLQNRKVVNFETFPADSIQGEPQELENIGTFPADSDQGDDDT